MMSERAILAPRLSSSSLASRLVCPRGSHLQGWEPGRPCERLSSANLSHYCPWHRSLIHIPPPGLLLSASVSSGAGPLTRALAQVPAAKWAWSWGLRPSLQVVLCLH